MRTLSGMCNPSCSARSTVNMFTHFHCFCELTISTALYSLPVPEFDVSLGSLIVGKCNVS